MIMSYDPTNSSYAYYMYENFWAFLYNDVVRKHQLTCFNAQSLLHLPKKQYL